jgi:hypothetical protein
VDAPIAVLDEEVGDLADRAIGCVDMRGGLLCGDGFDAFLRVTHHILLKSSTRADTSHR